MGYSSGMRLALMALLGCGAVCGQVRLSEFLKLTAAQVTQVLQLNTDLDKLISAKQQREYAVRQELQAEYAKPQPDARGVGQRYVELDSLEHEIATARAGVQVKVAGLLTDAQKALLQQVSAATVQGSLLRDASCAYLTDAIGTVPTGALRSGDFTVDPATGSSYAPFLLGVPVFGILSACSPDFPASIRNALALTDNQVSAIAGLQAAYRSLNARKQNRTADVLVEIRDETAKPAPDPLALGVRYAELGEIGQELTQADMQGRVAARALLTLAQRLKLQGLLDASAIASYIYVAESCHLLGVPAGTQGFDYTGAQCSPNF